MSTAESQAPPPLVEEKEEPTREAAEDEKPPSGPQHQPLGLQDTCVKTLARHLEVFAHPRHRYRVVPLDLFLRILRGCHSHSWVQAADLMLRVTRNLPCLDAPEVDDLYWRTVCELSVSPTTPITMPYPILVSQVVEKKKALDEWMAAAATRAVAAAAAGAGSKQGESQDSAKGEGGDAATTEKEREKGSKAASKEEGKGEADKGSKKEKGSACSRTDQEGKKKKKKEKKEKKHSTVNSGSNSGSGSTTAKMPPTRQKQQQQQEDQASAAVLRLLRDLSPLPVSVQLLKDADRAGETVRQLSKMKTKEGGKEGEGGSSGEGLVSEEVRRAAIKLRKKWKALVHEEQEKKDRTEEGEDEEKNEEQPMSPARVGARALVVQTWRDVYIFSKEYEELRRGWIGKRALALAEDHESKKRRTRGIEEKLGDAATIEAEARKGKPPVGNTERIRKLVNYRPPPAMDSKKKPFGGIAFVAPQKKKHLKVVKLR